MPETSEIEPLALAAILLWVAERTVGVEEEFLLVDPASGRPRAVGHAVLATSAAENADDDLAAELHREQLETAVVRDATDGTLVH